MNLQTLRDNFRQFAVLKLAPKTPDLKDFYKAHIEAHNEALFKSVFPNSGFDLFVPEKTTVVGKMKTQMISMEVKAEMLDGGEHSCGYYMFPRSSISKTPLMLANHTGIIDAGYRGPLIGAFRNTTDNEYIVEKDVRLLQICHPSLCPIYVELVDETELSTTERGEGGFGSTGK
jgi:dUTP pyrophosphatase